MPKEVQINGIIFKGMSIEEQKYWIKNTKPTENHPTLNEKQIEACRLYLIGENIALVGGPGVGKTLTTDRIEFLKSILDPNFTIARTATTGMASGLLNNGRTLYDFLKTGSDSCLSHMDEFRTRLQSERTGDMLRSVNGIQIDEASMLSDTAFGHLQTAAPLHRNNRVLPMGGIQCILSGDIMQLPVVDGSTGAGHRRRNTVALRSILENLPFYFKPVILTENMRSSEDLQHGAIIRALVQADPVIRRRAAELLNQSAFRGYMNAIDVLRHSRITGMTILTHTNDRVKLYNEIQMDLLRQENPSGPISLGKAKPLHSWASLPPRVKTTLENEEGLRKEEEHIRSQMRFEEDLILYLGQQVRLRKNTDEYKSGDKCHFIGVSEDGTVITLIRYSDNKKLLVTKCDLTSEFHPEIGFEQFPIVKDAAITVHKAQGSTINEGVIYDPLGIEYPCFKKSIARLLNVAISRTQTLKKIVLTEPISEDIITNPECQVEIERLLGIDYMSDYPTITLEELNAAFA